MGPVSDWEDPGLCAASWTGVLGLGGQTVLLELTTCELVPGGGPPDAWGLLVPVCGSGSGL